MGVRPFAGSAAPAEKPDASWKPLRSRHPAGRGPACQRSLRAATRACFDGPCDHPIGDHPCGFDGDRTGGNRTCRNATRFAGRNSRGIHPAGRSAHPTVRHQLGPPRLRCSQRRQREDRRQAGHRIRHLQQAAGRQERRHRQDRLASLARRGQLDPHIKKGSEDDVDAIGTRNIGGRGLGNWHSTNWEISAGKQYSMEIEKSAHLITDPVVVEYVNRVGQNIVKNSDCKVPFTIKVIDSDEINAMALPGGFFYVNSGLILAADEEAELAGVMAHETAHVCAHHAAREMTRANYAEIGSIPLIIFTQGSWTGYGIYEASQLAIPISFLEFSREFEAEADWLGVQYMYRAGYDPQAFIQIFEKLDALEKHKPGPWPGSSPTTRRRRTASRTRRRRLPPSCPRGRTTWSPPASSTTSRRAWRASRTGASSTTRATPTRPPCAAPAIPTTPTPPPEAPRATTAQPWAAATRRG